jgi:hypothetical protein
MSVPEWASFSICLRAGGPIMSVNPAARRIPASATNPTPAAKIPTPGSVPGFQRPSLITDITVEHGPVDLLGRLFLKADSAARARGVALSFGTY